MQGNFSSIHVPRPCQVDYATADMPHQVAKLTVEHSAQSGDCGVQVLHDVGAKRSCEPRISTITKHEAVHQNSRDRSKCQQQTSGSHVTISTGPDANNETSGSHATVGTEPACWWPSHLRACTGAVRGSPGTSSLRVKSQSTTFSPPAQPHLLCGITHT